MQILLTFNLTSAVPTNNSIYITLPGDLSLSSSMNCTALKGFTTSCILQASGNIFTITGLGSKIAGS